MRRRLRRVNGGVDDLSIPVQQEQCPAPAAAGEEGGARSVHQHLYPSPTAVFFVIIRGRIDQPVGSLELIEQERLHALIAGQAEGGKDDRSEAQQHHSRKGQAQPHPKPVHCPLQ